MNSHPRVLILLAAVTAVRSLVAQPAPPPAAPDSEIVQLPAFSISSEKDTGYMGKSALSSTRIAVDLSELPQSVKVLNNSFLKAVNPFMLTDILNYTGGAQNGQLNWTPGRLNIRGYTGDGDYNDSFSPSAGSAVDSAIYERFEVIKGPSAIFLATDGTPGGVVNKLTKSPLSTRSTTLRLQVGLFDANRVDLDTTGAFTKDGKFLYRLVAAQQYSDGYYDNTYMHRLTIMPALSYQFSPDTKFELKALYVDTDWPSYNGLAIDPRTRQMFDVPYTRSQSEDKPYNWRTDAVQRLWAKYTSRLNDHAVIHLAGMNAWNAPSRVESVAPTWNEGLRAFPANLVNYKPGDLIPRSTTADNQISRYRSLQADVNFNFATGPAKHNLLIGGEARESTFKLQAFAGTSSAWDPFKITTPTVTVNYAAPVAQTVNYTGNGRVFVLDTAKLFNDRLVLSYGLSRSRANSYTFNELTRLYTPAEFSVNKNLKQYGAVFKVVPGVNAFVGYNENFALNGVGLVNGVTGALPPKEGKQWELGLKNELLNKKLNVTVSYFDIKQTNNTVPSFPLDPLNPNVLVPGVISRGFDGDASWQFSSNLYLMGSFAWYEPKSVLGPAVNGIYVQPYYGRAVTGSIPVANTAKRTSSLFALYRFTHGSLKGLDVGLGYNYLSRRAITDGPNQVMLGYVDGRLLLNSSITYKYSQHLTYTLNLDNLTNEKYIYSVRSQNVIVPGQAFNAKAGIEYKF
ncbi:MAG: TonB-dependent receptor [Verrucomicrobia bacterium]|nr:TonB-dependent receptor [Verrucomicrobiota bacterium]